LQVEPASPDATICVPHNAADNSFVGIDAFRKIGGAVIHTAFVAFAGVPAIKEADAVAIRRTARTGGLAAPARPEFGDLAGVTVRVLFTAVVALKARGSVRLCIFHDIRLVHVGNAHIWLVRVGLRRVFGRIRKGRV
jgi:hypothetical protein